MIIASFAVDSLTEWLRWIRSWRAVKTFCWDKHGGLGGGKFLGVSAEEINLVPEFNLGGGGRLGAIRMADILEKSGVQQVVSAFASIPCRLFASSENYPPWTIV